MSTDGGLDETLPRFTVERKDGDTHLERWHHKQSRFASLVKILFTMFMSSMTLFCVVTSKLTVISIAQGFQNLKPREEGI